MKRFSLLFSICLLIALPFRGSTQSVSAPQPQQVTRYKGKVRLTGGVRMAVSRETASVKELQEFLLRNGRPVNECGIAPDTLPLPAIGDKSIRLDIRRVEHIPGVPAEGRNAYYIAVMPQEIKMASTSERGMKTACRIVEELYNEANAPKPWYRRIVPASKKVLPCRIITGWETADKNVLLRLNRSGFVPAERLLQHPEQIIPHYTAQVELFLTDPAEGWFLPGDILKLVNDREAIHAGSCYRYDQLRAIREKLAGQNIELIPVFDLTSPNARFREVTGHPMLSVEGFRFVRAMLDEFLKNTDFDSVTLLVPEGKYRKQLEAFMADYPQVTQLRFTE